MPVIDDEVSSVIKKRLFENSDDAEAEKIVETFLKEAEKEGILPSHIDRISYKEKFSRTYGIEKEIDNYVLERLLDDKKIVQKLDPSFIKDRFIREKPYIHVKSVLYSFYRTPGFPILASKDVILECISRGVREGVFGYGVLENMFQYANITKRILILK